MTDTHGKVEYNDRLDRLIFGGAIIGGNVLAMAVLSFVPIPQDNATVFGQIAGGLSACLGIIASATWKTNATERQQAQTLQTLAASAAAPLTTTTTTTTEKTDGQAGSGPAVTSGAGELGHGAGVGEGGSGADGGRADVAAAVTPAAGDGHPPADAPWAAGVGEKGKPDLP